MVHYVREWTSTSWGVRLDHRPMDGTEPSSVSMPHRRYPRHRRGSCSRARAHLRPCCDVECGYCDGWLREGQEAYVWKVLCCIRVGYTFDGLFKAELYEVYSQRRYGSEYGCRDA